MSTEIRNQPDQLREGHLWTAADQKKVCRSLEREELSIINHLAADDDPLVKREFAEVAMIVSDVTEVQSPYFNEACIVRFRYFADLKGERYRFIGVANLPETVASDVFRHQILDVEYFHSGQPDEACFEEFKKIVNSIERK